MTMISELIHEHLPTMKDSIRETRDLLHSLNNRRATLYARPITIGSHAEFEKDLAEIRHMEAHYLGQLQCIIITLGLLDHADFQVAITSKTVTP